MPLQVHNRVDVRYPCKLTPQEDGSILVQPVEGEELWARVGADKTFMRYLVDLKAIGPVEVFPATSGG